MESYHVSSSTLLSYFSNTMQFLQAVLATIAIILGVTKGADEW